MRAIDGPEGQLAAYKDRLVESHVLEVAATGSRVVVVDDVTGSQVAAEVSSHLFAGEYQGADVDGLVLPLHDQPRLAVEDGIGEVVADREHGRHRSSPHRDRHLSNAAVESTADYRERYGVDGVVSRLTHSAMSRSSSPEAFVPDPGFGSASTGPHLEVTSPPAISVAV